MNLQTLNARNALRTIGRQFLSFATVGIVGTLAQYTLLVILVEGFGVSATLSSVAGFVLGAVINYVLNYRYTFQSVKRHHEALTKFMAVAAIGAVVNAGLMLLLVDHVAMHYLVSQVIATGVVLVWNFVANRAWTFGG